MLTCSAPCVDVKQCAIHSKRKSVTVRNTVVCLLLRTVAAPDGIACAVVMDAIDNNTRSIDTEAGIRGRVGR